MFSISPVTLCLLDGTVSAVITHAANLHILFSTNDMLILMFYVTLLDSTTTLVLGHNWLHCYNPSIDWFAGQLLHFWLLLRSVPSSSSPGSNGSFELPATQIAPASTLSSDSSSIALGTTSSSYKDFSDNSFSSDALFPSVSFINAAAYARCACLLSSTVFTVTLHNYDPASALAAQTKGFSAQAEPADLSHIYTKMSLTSVIIWWNEHKHIYPCLLRMATIPDKPTSFSFYATITSIFVSATLDILLIRITLSCPIHKTNFCPVNTSSLWWWRSEIKSHYDWIVSVVVVHKIYQLKTKCVTT